jgi:hypothetical protein
VSLSSPSCRASADRWFGCQPRSLALFDNEACAFFLCPTLETIVPSGAMRRSNIGAHSSTAPPSLYASEFSPIRCR